MKKNSKLTKPASKKNALGRRGRQRAVAPALVWGREPRGERRGQTGPKGGPESQAGVAPRGAGRGWHKARQKKPSHPGSQGERGWPGAHAARPVKATPAVLFVSGC
jgi:hypothetical protein